MFPHPTLYVISRPNLKSVPGLSIPDFQVGQAIFSVLRYPENLSKILETELNVIPANYKNKCR